MTPENLRAYRQHLPLLEETVLLMSRRLGRMVPLEDLRSLAHDGLLEAMHTYDPSRSATVTYFGRKMRWAILDAVRREQRMFRLRSRAAALMASERLSEDDENAPDEPGLTEEHHLAALSDKLDKHAAGLALGLLSGGAGREAAERTPEDHATHSQVTSMVREMIRTLPERERQLLERHYFEGEEFETIATSLGISKSWASRLHAQSIALLGQAIREKFNEEI